MLLLFLLEVAKAIEYVICSHIRCHTKHHDGGSLSLDNQGPKTSSFKETKGELSPRVCASLQNASPKGSSIGQIQPHLVQAGIIYGSWEISTHHYFLVHILLFIP